HLALGAAPLPDALPFAGERWLFDHREWLAPVYIAGTCLAVYVRLRAAGRGLRDLSLEARWVLLVSLASFTLFWEVGRRSDFEPVDRKSTRLNSSHVKRS